MNSGEFQESVLLSFLFANSVASPSLYTDFIHFKEDSIITVDYDQLSDFYISKA